MKVAIFSDIHDNIWKLASALKLCQGADAMIFCGDFCAPFTLVEIGEQFKKPVHVVFGNNDGDRFLLNKQAARFGHMTLHGEFARIVLDNKKIAVTHYPEIAEEIAGGGAFDVVCYGHNHELKISKIGQSDFINPGEIMGRFGRSTFVFYDTETSASEIIDVL